MNCHLLLQVIFPTQRLKFCILDLLHLQAGSFPLAPPEKGHDSCSQRVSRSQWSRSRCFSGIPLLFLWSNGCWQFDLGSSAVSESSLHIWKFTVDVLLKPSLKDSEHYLVSMWNDLSCTVVSTFFVIAFLWDCNENWALPDLWPRLSFPNLLANREPGDWCINKNITTLHEKFQNYE